MFQNLINILYRYPKSKLLQINRMGGWRNVRAIVRSRQAMEHAATQIKCPKFSEDTPNQEIWFLTGKKFWYQTLFCIKSLIESSQQDFFIHICDDGSLDDELTDRILTQVPYIHVHRLAEIEERLEHALPRDQFPYLWHKRTIYPHIKKLMDVHAGTQGWKLVLDSDMLFFQRPELMIQWLENPDRPFHIYDTQNSYGYSFALMEQLAEAPIPEKLNVGMIGLQSESIDWNQLENWSETLERQEGASYYLEQALSAMLVAQQKEALTGPADQYIVMPSKEEVLDPNAVLHHYVDTSKEWYFKNAWRRLLN